MINLNEQRALVVVIVDDNRDILDLLHEVISHEYSDEVNVISYDSPTEALKHITQHPVDLVLCDLVMPEISGEELMRRCRAMNRGIKFITMTGHPKISSALDQYRQGDLAYLTKPFKNEELFRFVNHAIKGFKSWRKAVIGAV